MKKNYATQPAVNKADSSSVEGISKKEQDTRDAATIDNRIMKSGTWEFLIGFWIILATVTMYVSVNQITSLAWLRAFLNFIVLFSYLITYQIQKHNLRKEFPNVGKKTIINSLETAPIMFVIVPWLISLVMVYLQFDKLGIVIPPNVEKVIYMILATGFFSGIFFIWYSRYGVWRVLVWALATLAIVVLLGFDVINLSNFFMVYLPLGIFILLSGLKVNLENKRHS